MGSRQDFAARSWFAATSCGRLCLSGCPIENYCSHRTPRGPLRQQLLRGPSIPSPCARIMPWWRLGQRRA